MVICLERGADLHMFQLKPLPLTVSCFSKIQIGFSFLVPAHLGSPGERAVKRVCVLCEVPRFIDYKDITEASKFTKDKSGLPRPFMSVLSSVRRTCHGQPMY